MDLELGMGGFSECLVWWNETPRKSKRVFIGGVIGVWTPEKRFKWEGNGKSVMNSSGTYQPTTLGQQISYQV